MTPEHYIQHIRFILKHPWVSKTIKLLTQLQLEFSQTPPLQIFEENDHLFEYNDN